MDGKADGADGSFRALIFALLALACGHMLSTLLRTIPAISLDVMAADFRTPPQTLASLTSIYHFAFAASQIPVGAATSGMLMCPMTLAAKQMSATRFGLWSGIILSIGNIGMLLSASPLAFVVELWGWRAGFWISAGLGAVVAIAVFLLVPKQPVAQTDQSSPLSQMAEVLRIGLSRPLRGLIALSLVSLAASLVLRGLWGGP